MTEIRFDGIVVMDGRSDVIPVANIIRYGTVRDIDKGEKRDRRSIKRDVINLEAHNPDITGAMIDAVNTLNTLFEARPDDDRYIWNKVLIKSVHLRRGLGLYNKAIVASLGGILAQGGQDGVDGRSRWLDVAGEYITKREVDDIVSSIENGQITSLDAIKERFETFAQHYTDYAYSWAVGVLEQLLGHTPSATAIREAIESGRRSQEDLDAKAQSDKQRACSMDMAVG